MLYSLLCYSSSDTTSPMSSAMQMVDFSIYFGQYASSLFMHAYVAFGFDAVIFMEGYFIMPGVLKPTLDAMVEWALTTRAVCVGTFEVLEDWHVGI